MKNEESFACDGKKKNEELATALGSKFFILHSSFFIQSDLIISDSPQYRQ